MTAVDGYLGHLCEFRAQLLAQLPAAMKAGQARQKWRGQISIFGDDEPREMTYIPGVRPLAVAELLANEKKALGFYLSGHPLDLYAEAIEREGCWPIADLGGIPPCAEVVVAGMIGGVSFRQVSQSRSGQTRMAKFTLEDTTGTVGVVAWPDVLAGLGDVVANNRIVFATGRLDRRREPAEMVVSGVKEVAA